MGFESSCSKSGVCTDGGVILWAWDKLSLNLSEGDDLVSVGLSRDLASGEKSRLVTGCYKGFDSPKNLDVENGQTQTNT